MKLKIPFKGPKLTTSIFSIAALLLVLLVIPLLVPVSTIKPEVELELSQVLGRSVRIGRLELGLLPRPRLLARDVSISNGSQQGLQVSDIKVVPDFGEFFHGNVVLKNVDLDGLICEWAFIESLVKDLHAQSDNTDSILRVQRITADSVTIKWDKNINLGPYTFDMDFSVDGDMDHLSLYRQDKQAHLEMTAMDAGYNINLIAANWQLPITTVPIFKNLSINGFLHKERLALNQVNADIFGGNLQGSADLAWGGSIQLKSKLQLQKINSKSLLQAFSRTGLDGELNGEVRLAFVGDSPGQLFEYPHVEGNLRLVNGVIYKPDNINQLLKYDDIEIKGVLERQNLKISSLSANAYSGSLQAKGEVDWQFGLRFMGQASGANVDVESLLDDLVNRKIISGRFTGSAGLQLYAENTSQILERPFIEGNFTFHKGVIYKADLGKAANNFSSENVNGGQTVFDELKGKVKLSNNDISLTDLEIKSEELEANGHINVYADKKLDGVVDVGLRKTASIVSIPVQVSGTLEDPDLRPTKSALVGGALGTTILGPVIGTAIGVKISSFLHRNSTDTKDKNSDAEEDGDDADED